MSLITIDVKTKPQSAPWTWLQEMWIAADAIDSVRAIWLFDHLRPIFASVDDPCYEGWTLLSRLSAETRRAKVGIMVSNALLRNVVLLAKMITTVDNFTDGRLDLGLGAGWDEQELLSAGIAFPDARDRLRILDEQCTALRELLSKGTSSFNGSHIRLNEARSFPLPIQRPHPPFTIGGTGPKMLDLVAQHADCWNYPGFSVNGFTKKLNELKNISVKQNKNIMPIPSTQITMQSVLSHDKLTEISNYVLAGAERIVLYFEFPFSPDALKSCVETTLEKINVLNLNQDSL